MEAEWREFRAAMQTENAEFKAAMHADNIEFKAAIQAALAEQRTATQADLKDLELRLTTAINQVQVRTMQWTVLVVSVVAGVLVAVDRLLGPATGG